MAIKIIRLGSPREKNEGLRIGTVRRPPRGIPKREYASRDFFDVWLPILSPSAELLKEGKRVKTEKDWLIFKRKFKNEMKSSEASQVLDLVAALSHQTDLSIGCYCEEEARCHRSILKELLLERGAKIRF